MRKAVISIAVCILLTGCQHSPITINSPALNVVTRPMIQIVGHFPTEISHVTFDLTNARGIQTNCAAYVIGPSGFDRKTLSFTNYSFQCYDVPMTKGCNVITVHVTDLSGVTYALKRTYILDYSHATNPPVLTLIWPQNGQAVAGDNFTLKAKVNDETASVRATIENDAGQSYPRDAIVERNGLVWVKNLPLSRGTNYLSVIATDAAGNSTSTNIDVFESKVVITLEPLPGDQLNKPRVKVHGTVSDPTCHVQVNGVDAVVQTNGIWFATNVPVSPTGTAEFNIQAFSNTDQK
jgi:hypothetical protein